MLTTPPPGLREHLAARAQRATELTSPQRVLDRVEQRLLRPRRRARLVVVAAAALVAAALSGALLLPRLSQRASAPAHPTAPPTGVPLVWQTPVGSVSAGMEELNAYDWKGHRVGTLRLAEPGQSFTWQSSDDGTTLLIVPTQGTAYMVDASGRQLGNIAGLRAPHWPQLPHGFTHFRAVFSADDRALCVEGGNAFDHPVLHLLRLGLSDRTVVELGGTVPSPTWSVMACDAAGDRAVLTGRVPVDGRAILRVIQLSTGREILRHVDLSSGGPRFNVLSSDGRWLAVSMLAGDAVLYDLTRDAAVGQVRLQRGDVRAVLAGGRRVLAVEYSGHQTQPQTVHQHLEIVEVATGQILWSYDLHDPVTLFPTAPASAPLLVFTTYDNQPGPGGCSSRVYHLVDASGPEVIGIVKRVCI